MQLDKSRKVVGSLLEICDSLVENFYLAANSGMISNKMECISFSYKVIHNTTKSYNLVPKGHPLFSLLNTVIAELKPDVDSVNNTFPVMFNALQQYKVLLTAWLDELGQGDG